MPRPRSCRGQATVFVIAGLVLLFILAGLYALKGYTQRLTLDEQLDALLADFARSAVQSYVESCVSAVAQRGVQLAGLQGGRPFPASAYLGPGETAQAGTHFLPVKIGAAQFEVAYGIHRSQIAELPSDENTYPHSAEEFSTYTYSYFGTNVLPKLCDKDGPNKEDFSEAGANPRDTQTCLSGTYTAWDPEPSIQRDLATYVAASLADCLRQDQVFQSQLGILELLAQPRANVTWGDESAAVDVVYPARIRLRQGRSASRLLAFSARLPVRFKTVYNLAYVLILREARDIDFDAAEDWRTLPYVDNALLVVLDADPVGRTCPTCEGAADNLIAIVDSASTLGGEPFLFQFAVQNRPPDLNRIDLTSLAPGAVFEDGPLSIPVQVRDPDDEPVHLEAESTTGLEPCQFPDDPRDTTCVLTLPDPGLGSEEAHELTITVTDETDTALSDFQLEDWQTLRFRVRS